MKRADAVHRSCDKSEKRAGHGISSESVGEDAGMHSRLQRPAAGDIACCCDWALLLHCMYVAHICESP
jgi:hypothetical protein